MNRGCSTWQRLDYPLPIYIIFSPLNSHLLFFNYTSALFTLTYGSSYFHLSMAQGLFQNNQGPRGTAFTPGVRTLAPLAARQFSSSISSMFMFPGTQQSPQPAPMCTSSVKNRQPRELFSPPQLSSRRNSFGVSLPPCPEAPGNVGRRWAEVVRCALLPTPDDCMRFLGAVRLSVEPSRGQRGPRSEVHAPPPHPTPSPGALVRVLRRDWRESRAFSAESPALHFRWCIDTLLEPAGMRAPVNETFLLPLQRC